nr:S8 family serine peptidase [Kiloniellales bacterium]
AAESGVTGLLPRAQLFAADAFHARDDGDRADTLDLVRALDWLIAEQVTVVNMSFSGRGNKLLATAIDESAQRGIILVGAAGEQRDGKARTFPAAYDAVVAVTAIDSRLRPYRAAARGPHLAFAAPGVEVPLAKAGGGKIVQTGTSFAAPFVSAAFALLRGSDLGDDSESAHALLRASARDLGPPGRDPIFGWGLVRLPKSVSCGR